MVDLGGHGWCCGWDNGGVVDFLNRTRRGFLGQEGFCGYVYSNSSGMFTALDARMDIGRIMDCTSRF